MLEDSTTAIIMGSPSGTATTSTVSPRVRAWKHWAHTYRQSDSFCRMIPPSKPLSRRKTLRRNTTATSPAATYPMRLICPASLVSRRLRGLSRVSSCTSSEMRPRAVASPPVSPASHRYRRG